MTNIFRTCLDKIISEDFRSKLTLNYGLFPVQINEHFRQWDQTFNWLRTAALLLLCLRHPGFSSGSLWFGSVCLEEEGVMGSEGTELEVPVNAVGRRVSCDGERATVRYVGPVPPTSGRIIIALFLWRCLFIYPTISNPCIHSNHLKWTDAVSSCTTNVHWFYGTYNRVSVYRWRSGLRSCFTPNSSPFQGPTGDLKQNTVFGFSPTSSHHPETWFIG